MRAPQNMWQTRQKNSSFLGRVYEKYSSPERERKLINFEFTTKMNPLFVLNNLSSKCFKLPGGKKILPSQSLIPFDIFPSLPSLTLIIRHLILARRIYGTMGESEHGGIHNES